MASTLYDIRIDNSYSFIEEGITFSELDYEPDMLIIGKIYIDGVFYVRYLTHFIIDIEFDHRSEYFKNICVYIKAKIREGKINKILI